MENKVRIERVKKSLTQKELAKIIGVCDSVISNIENGFEPSLIIATRLSKFFNLTIEQLFDTKNINVI